MMRHVATVVINLVMIGLLATTAVLADSAELLTPAMGGEIPRSNVAGKKLIRSGQELLQPFHGHRGLLPSEVPALVPKLQQTGYDGLIFTVCNHKYGQRREQDLLAPTRGNMFGAWFNTTRWDYKDIEPSVKAFQQVKDWGRLTDNFIWAEISTRRPGVPKIFNDQDWDALEHNARVLAKVVRESGFKGIFMDSEHWTPYEVFHYLDYVKLAESRGEQVCPFGEVQAKVRQRGEQWARALSDVFPEITVIWYPAPYQLAWNYGGRVKKGLDAIVYGLQPAFFDGVLVGLDTRGTVVASLSSTYPDCEYRDMMAEVGLSRDAALMLSSVPKLVKSRLTHAVGLFTDFSVHEDPLGKYPPLSWSHTNVFVNQRDPEREKYASHNAMVASDRYAWSYGEGSQMLGISQLPMDINNPPPLLRQYWQAHLEAHEPQNLYWRPPLIVDESDYSEANAAAAKADVAYWVAKEKEGFRVIAELPESWRFMLDTDLYYVFGRGGGPHTTKFDDRTWHMISIRRCWQSQGFPAKGPAQYRVWFDGPAEVDPTQEIFLAFGSRGRSGALGHVHINGHYTDSKYLSPDVSMINVSGYIKPGQRNLLNLLFLRGDEGPSGLMGQVKLLVRAKLPVPMQQGP